MISFTYSKNNTSTQRAANAFFFLGISFDVLGASMGLLGALSVQWTLKRTQTEVADVKEMAALLKKIARHKGNVNADTSGAQADDHIWEERQRYLQLVDALEVRIGRRQQERGRLALVTPIIALSLPAFTVGCGVFCFFIGLSCFVFDTQPASVSITTQVIIALGIVVLPVVTFAHSSL